MHERFDNAVWRLTAWYTAILIVLSLAFGAIVYVVAHAELHSAINTPSAARRVFVESALATQYRQELLDQSLAHLFNSLALFTVSIVMLGGICSYFFARRTLQPIADAAEAQERFSSDVAHELKTPLTVIQTELEVALRDPAATKSAYRETLDSNLDEVARLRALTDRLLLLSHDQAPDCTPTDINEVITEAIDRVQGRAELRGTTIESNARPATVLADAASLADALVILLDNAIKYSPAGSTVTISSTSRRRSGHYEIHVTDHGGGVADADRPYIFDRFYRADQSRTNSSVNGTGLGLPLARKLMALQSGRAYLSRSSTQGSTFTLSIPRTKSPN